MDGIKSLCRMKKFTDRFAAPHLSGAPMGVSHAHLRFKRPAGKDGPARAGALPTWREMCTPQVHLRFSGRLDVTPSWAPRALLPAGRKEIDVGRSVLLQVDFFFAMGGRRAFVRPACLFFRLEKHFCCAPEEIDHGSCGRLRRRLRDADQNRSRTFALSAGISSRWKAAWTFCCCCGSRQHRLRARWMA